MADRPRAARQPRERKNRPKSGVEGDAENAKSPYEQRTEWNQHPSSSVEGGVEGLNLWIFIKNSSTPLASRRLCASLSLKKGSSGVKQTLHLQIGVVDSQKFGLKSLTQAVILFTVFSELHIS
jgi:hypothetical protein